MKKTKTQSAETPVSVRISRALENCWHQRFLKWSQEAEARLAAEGTPFSDKYMARAR